MSTEENKALARRAYELVNQQNWAAFYELVAPDFVFHNASMTIQGLEAYKQFVSMYLTAFPDLHFTIDDIIAEGDTVVVRSTARGTHQGELMGIPPTGKQIAVSGISITRIANKGMRGIVTYYRVALQQDHSSTWMWKSTVLVSLDAVFGFIKLHQMVSKDRFRVFYSSSVEYLNEMLDRENQGLLSNSLTAEQLVKGSGHIDQLEMQLFESACNLHPYMGTAVASLLTAHIWQMQSQHVPSNESTKTLEMRRLAVEMIGSADHDTAYHFSLLASLPQILAWTRLLARVQCGELEP